MIQLQADVDSYDELIEWVEESYSGTIFEGLEQVYVENRELLEFMFENQDEYLPDAFIGSEEDLIEDGIDIDEEAIEKVFEEEIDESDDISYLSVLEFMLDFSNFIYVRVNSQASSFEDVVRGLFLSTGEFQELSDEEVIEKYMQEFEEQQVEQVKSLREMADEIEAVEELDEKNQEEMLLTLLFSSNNLRDEANQIETMSNLEFILHNLEEQIANTRQMLKRFKFIDTEKPSVGEYLVFEIQPSSNKVEYADEYEFEFSSDTIYRIVVKVTDEVLVEDEGIEYPEFEYDVIAYDDELLELYPAQYIINQENPHQESNRIGPQEQDEFVVYTESPIGSIEMKETRN